MNVSKRPDIRALQAEYSALASVVSAFSEELNRQLVRLVSDSDVRLGFPLQVRVKSWDSIAEKISRVSLGLNSIRELQDLVGFRIIVLFRRDLDTIARALRQHLEVAGSYDTAERLREDQFGYSSIHYVVKLPRAWLALPTFAGMEELLAEIQLRTLAQHIWAEASQNLQYKRETSVPATLKRGIYRVSALLETVDLEFERVLEQRSWYQEQAGGEDSDEPLNVDLLAKLLDEGLPPENKRSDEAYDEALEDLLEFGITTRDGVRNLIQGEREGALLKDRSIIDQIRSKVPDVPYRTDQERIDRGVFFAHVGLLRQMLRQKFGEKFATYMNKRSKRRTSTE